MYSIFFHQTAASLRTHFLCGRRHSEDCPRRSRSHAKCRRSPGRAGRSGVNSKLTWNGLIAVGCSGFKIRGMPVLFVPYRTEYGMGGGVLEVI